MLRTVAGLRDWAPRPWTGSWTEPSVQPVRSGPSAARLRGIPAASACDARSHTSHNPPVVGSSPTRPTCAFMLHPALTVDRFADRCRRYRVWCRPAKHPSRSHRATAEGLWRAKVYAGKDPLTGREIRFRKTCKSELAAQKELGKPPHISRPDRRTASGPTPIPQVAEVRQPRFIRFVQICVRDRPWFLLPRLWCRPWRRRRGFRRPGPR